MSERRVEELSPLVGARAPVYVVTQEVMTGILGMKFHSGVMACGRRKARGTIDALVPRDKSPLTVVVCPEIANVENIGLLIRLSAGFGVDAMILGERCHDPFWRQSIRVSMGTVFRLPIVQSVGLATDLKRLREEWKIELVATVLDDAAESLASSRRGSKLALLFGNEAQGLDAHWVELCDRRVTIPMHHGTDSLNVAVAAGIVLYHFTSPNVIIHYQSGPLKTPRRADRGVLKTTEGEIRYSLVVVFATCAALGSRLGGTTWAATPR
jgi:tRNA G18 (ribose-2'-O)-methylase SpoU